jgi:ribonucleotide reductase alpha subunit
MSNTYNYLELSSQVTLDSLNKDKLALDEYLRYVKNNFLILNDNTLTTEELELYNKVKLSYKIKNSHDSFNSYKRFKYLTTNRFYSNFFKYYKDKDVIDLIFSIYNLNFKFPSFMSAYQFYNDYSLKSDDKQFYYENYEDAIIGISLYLARDNIHLAKEFALTMIKQEYQPATPTFLNARKKKRGEMISCFLLDVDDSLNSIMYQLSQVAQLSKIGGGVALNLSKLRSKGESIKGIANVTKGVVPVMKIMEDITNYVDQMGQRKGAGVVYLNVFHYDIIDFLDTKKINSDEKSRIQALSLGVIIPDKFIELCKENKPVNLFAPHSIYKLYGVHFDDMDMDIMYDELSNNSDIIKHTMDSRDLLNIIASIQFESGYPYLMFRDNANRVNPLKGLERINMTNLCCFTGDTVISLYPNVSYPDTKTMTIKELAEINNTFTVMSAEEYNHQRSYYHDQVSHGYWKFKQNKATAFKTGTKSIIKLKLSNGDTIKCTPDHKLALHKGGYIEAKDSLNMTLCNYDYYEIMPDGSFDDNSVVTVVSIKEQKKLVDVYCLNVENNHNFIIKGKKGEYLVHNCEIFQSQKLSIINNDGVDDDIGYDVNCILGSLNIVNVMKNKSLKNTIHTAIQMLTNVSDISSIPNAKTVKKANDLFHSVGLGVMNLHGYFVLNNIPYESEEAKDFCNIFFMILNFYSLEKSMLIAQDKEKTFYGFEKSEYKNGNYFNQYIKENIVPTTEKVTKLFNDIYIPTQEDWINLKKNVQQYGLYNSYRLAIAPTGKISYLQNSTQSVMPITQHIEDRPSNNRIMYYPMPFLSKDNLLLYKLAYNMDMMKLLDLISVIQKHVDQGISTTLFITSDYSTRDLQKLYAYAHHKGLKSLYYTRIKNLSYESECEACVV